MKSLTRIIALCAVLSSTVCFANEPLTGNYTGSMQVTTPRGTQNTHMSLNIESVENGVVKAVLSGAHKYCTDKYPMEGTLKGTLLILKAPDGVQCFSTVKLTVDGNKLTGTVGQSPIEFSK